MVECYPDDWPVECCQIADERDDLKAEAERLRGLLERIATRATVGLNDPTHGDTLWEEIRKALDAKEGE
jgi:hypothetical protein